jgi:putative ABC transport system permease protein
LVKTSRSEWTRVPPGGLAVPGAGLAGSNNLLIAIIAILAAVTLVNTLVMATVGRRDSLRLLSRVGATTRQLLSMTGWQAITVSVTGIGLGIVFGAAFVLVITKVLTGSWTPTVTWAPVVVVIVGVVALATLSGR